ncbi:MAG: DUF87 domain-containing protein [Gemmatimonadota bacterium]
MSDWGGGRLFLGGVLDQDGQGTDEHLIQDADDLTTHGVIVGMTGSGKTGLGVILLEEALLSGVPTLVIDPKGDMGNLMLHFPQLRPDDFRPWIDSAEAKRKGVSEDELAAATAQTWKEGLASWGIGSARMEARADAAQVALYTPGSTAGIPLNIVGSLAAPTAESLDLAVLRDEIQDFVSSLLVLAGLESDPLSSPEHILLSNLIEQAWSEGRDLSLPALIGLVQGPPLRKLGVFELDVFFPPKDRTKLAMRLNGLVASPSFAEWLEGPPLDIQQLLWTDDGRPRASIVSIAHLSEHEQQFVVTLILSKLVTWMSQQPGTSELRALVYIDEVFGFAPPTAEPPTKRPILTLYKKARAHGIGMVLSTQNPVDLDYKIMSNAGTWMIGRLQTERDKARILEALRSASGDVDVDRFDALIGGLGKRQFVRHTARSDKPVVFGTRWAMSYLRGPLTRHDVARLTADAPERGVRTAAAAATETEQEPVPALGDFESTVAPAVASGVRVHYMRPDAPWAQGVGAVSTGKRYRAGVVARVHLLFDDRPSGLDHREEWEAVLFPIGRQARASDALAVDVDDRDFTADSPAEAVYEFPEARIDQATFFRRFKTELTDYLYRERRMEVFRNRKLKLYSRVGEKRQQFEVRCAEAAEDLADADAAKLQDRFATRLKRARSQLDRAEQRERELGVDVQQRGQQELVAGAGELLSYFLGGRRRTRALSGVASRRSQTRRTKERLRSAEERASAKEAEIEDLEADLADELDEISTKWSEAAGEIEVIDVGLEKTDIQVEEVSLVWIPVG